MFQTKQKQLFDPNASKKASGKVGMPSASPIQPFFVQAALKKQAVTTSGNGAKKYSTTGLPFVDQFGKLGTFKAPRDFNTIQGDAEILWAQDPLNAVKFALYLRTIPRKVQMFNGETTENSQKGGELKHEAIMRMIWLHMKSPESFWKNIGLFVSLGSWHDVFTMLQYDLVFNGWDNRKLDWTKFGKLILTALKNEKTCELVKKYLPQIKTNSACKTVEAQANNMIAKWLCSLLFGGKGKVKKEGPTTYAKYRKLKTSGTAHEWQKLISQQKFTELEFGEIHGRALNLLVRSKFLFNHGLSDKYAAWVKKPTTQVKYTGFVHELFNNVTRSTDSNSKETINKQFQTLVEKGQAEGVSSLIVVRDTSASMGSTASGTNQSCFNIGKALALYFSEFLKGKFANSFIEFNSTAKMHTWKGQTPVDKWNNDSCNFVGSTNFESVLHLFADIKRQGVSEDEFPVGILCISDSEFNPSQLGATNVEAARNILRKAGFSKTFVDNFRIVLWNLQSNYYGATTGQKFETFGGVPNVYYFSGYSASVISFLTNTKVETAEDLFNAAMDQEVLNLVELG